MAATAVLLEMFPQEKASVFSADAPSIVDGQQMKHSFFHQIELLSPVNSEACFPPVAETEFVCRVVLGHKS